MDSLTAESHAETLAKVLPLLEEGRHEEALPFLELHKSKKDEPIWSYLMALCLACMTRGPEGLILLETTAKEPDFAQQFGIPRDANNLLRTSALNHLMFETSVDSESLEPWLILHRYAEILGHREFQAKSVVGRMKLDPENSEVIELFLQVFEDAPADKVIPILDDVVNSRPQACQPRALLGSFLQQRGKTALAIRHLKTAHESDPKAMEPHLYLGKIYLAQARFDDAEKELSEAMAKGTTPTVALLVEVANCQRATYRYEEALQTLFRAFEIHPPTFRHWDQLVDTAQNSGNNSQLVDALRKAAERYPNDARLRQRFAMVAFRQGEPLAAREQLKATGIFETPTKDPALARLAAEISQALGESNTALNLIEALWKENPNSPETSRLYGEALLADEQFQEAEALLRNTAKNNPNDRALQISWGRSLLALEDAERAHRAFSLASRLDPDDPEAMAEQGRAMLILGLHEEAQNVLKESAKKIDPPLAVTLAGLGEVYEHKNLHDIARDFYRQALSRQPDRLEAARGLIRTCALDGSSTPASDALEICSALPTPFARLKLWLNLLKGSFLEGAPQDAKGLKDRVYPEITKPLAEDYKAFLDSSETQLLSKLAKDLESRGEPEKARETWRYAVSSPIGELSEKASTELKRLDAYRPPSGEATATPPTEDDPLASLLGATLPEGEENPLFAPETPRQEPTAASVEADLFLQEEISSEEPPKITEDDVLEALFAVDLPTGVEPAAIAEPAQEVSPSDKSETDELSFEIPLPAPISHSETSPSPETESSADDILAVEPTQDTVSGEDEELFSDQPVSMTSVEPESEMVEQAIASETEVSHQEPVALEAESAVSLEEPEPESATAVELPSDEPQSDSPAELSSIEQEAGADPQILTSVEFDEPATELEATEIEPSSPPEPSLEEPEAEASPDPAATGSEDEMTSEPTEAQELRPLSVLLPMTTADTGLLESSPPLDPPPVVTTSTPSNLANATPTDQVVREELLPIPMAADFSPLTRRQLHYHEALASSGSGFVNPENLAHLLLQSVVGHEPPDPSSEQGASSVELLQKALLASAVELEQSEQFRAAVRVLRTALLYQPNSEELLETLARVQLRWADWLAQRHEFAHAVSLLRDILQRQPVHEGAAAQLETHYQRWMDWSEASGDSAARDLLAVYLGQERTALETLRREWAQRQAPTATANVAQAPPPVPTSLPSATPSSAAPQTTAAVVAKPSTPPAPQSTAAAIAAATTPSPVAEPAITSAPAETSSSASTASSMPEQNDDSSESLFGSKEEALETLEAAPDDESVAEGVFAIYADSMRDLTAWLKERSTSSPDQPAWLLLLARAFRRSGSETMAVIQYQKYIKVAPSREAYEELAQTYEELGKDDFAKMTRRKAERA